MGLLESPIFLAGVGVKKKNMSYASSPSEAFHGLLENMEFIKIVLTGSGQLSFYGLRNVKNFQ